MDSLYLLFTITKTRKLVKIGSKFKLKILQDLISLGTQVKLSCSLVKDFGLNLISLY